MSYFAASTSDAGPSFCPVCSTLLTLPEIDHISCDNCGWHCKYADLAKLEVVTTSHTKPLQPWVAQSQGAEEDKGRARALVDEECPKCSHRGLYFYTMQLRSADEGQTVFYECPSCAHKYSVNN
mmetsp:Transcript_921/g.2601  ORF Transcript_921/g.2601 Transcript_921/m.2601 type:complete len:124 (-) Transcript_921:30-401(-)